MEFDVRFGILNGTSALSIENKNIINASAATVDVDAS